MMRAILLSILLLACCFASLGDHLAAQADRVKFRFEVDGKQVDEKFKVLLYLSGKAVEPEMFGSSFTVPPEAQGRESAGVRFFSEKYDLYFDPVYLPKFKTDWTVGIDNKPFDEENADSEEPESPDKELSGIRYIHFVSKSGLDTRMVVKSYTSHSQQASSAPTRHKQQNPLKRSVKGRRQ